MKKILLLLLFILSSCENKQSDENKTDTGLEPYSAEYGIPDQSLLTPCSGEQNFARPISRCIRRSTGETVSNILCSNLSPVYMAVLSPNGNRITNIKGGTRIDSCNEGSSEILSSITNCNEGFFFYGTQCLGYGSIGNYIQFLDQIVGMGFLSNDYSRLPPDFVSPINPLRNRGLILNLTMGADSSFKEKDGIKLILIQE